MGQAYLVCEELRFCTPRAGLRIFISCSRKNPRKPPRSRRARRPPPAFTTAEDRLVKLRAEAVAAASSDPDKLASLSKSAASLEFEIATLTEALRQAEQAIEIAEEAARREADKSQREQTSKELHALADNLEKAVAPLPDNLEGLRVAIAAALPIIGENVFAVLLANLRAEIPAAVEFFAAEIRARADQTLAGTAPPTMPAPPVPTVIKEEEPLPEITVFVLDLRVTWPIDAGGRRQSLGPFQIGGVPEFWAQVRDGARPCHPAGLRQVQGNAR